MAHHCCSDDVDSAIQAVHTYLEKCKDDILVRVVRAFRSRTKFLKENSRNVRQGGRDGVFVTSHHNSRENPLTHHCDSAQSRNASLQRSSSLSALQLSSSLSALRSTAASSSPLASLLPSRVVSPRTATNTTNTTPHTRNNADADEQLLTLSPAELAEVKKTHQQLQLERTDSSTDNNESKAKLDMSIASISSIDDVGILSMSPRTDLISEEEASETESAASELVRYVDAAEGAKHKRLEANAQQSPNTMNMRDATQQPKLYVVDRHSAGRSSDFFESEHPSNRSTGFQNTPTATPQLRARSYSHTPGDVSRMSDTASPQRTDAGPVASTTIATGSSSNERPGRKKKRNTTMSKNNSITARLDKVRDGIIMENFTPVLVENTKLAKYAYWKKHPGVNLHAASSGCSRNDCHCK